MASKTCLAEVGLTVSINGIDEAKAVEIGGIRQWITVRGRDRRSALKKSAGVKRAG